jgi:hypothetical protein
MVNNIGIQRFCGGTHKPPVMSSTKASMRKTPTIDQTTQKKSDDERLYTMFSRIYEDNPTQSSRRKSMNGVAENPRLVENLKLGDWVVEDSFNDVKNAFAIMCNKIRAWGESMKGNIEAFFNEIANGMVNGFTVFCEGVSIPLKAIGKAIAFVFEEITSFIGYLFEKLSAGLTDLFVNLILPEIVELFSDVIGLLWTMVGAVLGAVFEVIGIILIDVLALDKAIFNETTIMAIVFFFLTVFVWFALVLYSRFSEIKIPDKDQIELMKKVAKQELLLRKKSYL